MGRQIPVFQRNMMHSSSELKYMGEESVGLCSKGARNAVIRTTGEAEEMEPSRNCKQEN
jgi:hypothetical protein